MGQFRNRRPSGRPRVLGLAFGALVRLAFGAGDCQTGDGYAMASTGSSALLAVEIEAL